MISNPRDKGLRGKQAGGGSSHEAGKISEATPSTSSRQWSAFRNPRIVRVSRTFGGKDRHSKVCTVRGLRDRRIRLSVPTAIQLYDLQHKLGLSQPSKVVDWLLDATKNDIDKLPPLQIPLPGYGQFHQPVLFSHHQSNIASPFFDPNSTFIKDVGFHSLGIKIDSTSAADHLDGRVQNCSGTGFSRDIEASTRAKDKQAETITEKGKWIRANEGGGIGSYSAAEQVSAQNFFPLATHSSMPTLLSNTNMPFVNSYHWEASNLSLSTEFGSHGFQSQAENSLNSPSPLHLSSGSQLFFCPPPPMPPLFPSYPPCVNDQSRDMNHFQLLSSSSSQHILPPISRAMSSRTKPFSLNLNPGLLHFLNNNESNPGEDKTDS